VEPESESYDVPVPGAAEPLVVAGQQALVTREWARARASFKAALEQEQSAEALDGLGIALGWLDEVEASLRYRERAYAEFRRRSEPFQAAVIAMQLCSQYASSLGNLAASRGWLGRLERVVEQFGLPPPMEAWVLLCRASLASASNDPHAALGYGRQALEIARRYPDAPGPNAELCALSETGAALVELGRIEEGTALLDEAMAAALAGEDESPETLVYTSCKTVVACARAAEVRRATRWIRAADEFNRRYGSPHVYILCRLHYGSVLLATGQWAEAERELLAALEKMPKTTEPRLHAEVLAKLAELRVAQGRTEEAARLLDGFEDDAATGHALGSIHLARGEHAVAASILARRARELGEASLQGGPLLELLVQAELEHGKATEAAASARRLAELGAGLASDVIVARGERARGRVLVAAADGPGAVPHLERALEAFARLEMPLEIARTRLLLARALGDAEREVAIAEARAALASFERIGAASDADAAAAFLRSLGVKAARTGPRGIGVLTKREAEVLWLLGEGLSNREMAARMFITRKTVENHVANVLSKLRLRGRGEAAAYAVRHFELHR
jgi:DNA-binding CsgD family transcriptional regulator/predicted negative regulator of RcsB-dependent stress response